MRHARREALDAANRRHDGGGEDGCSGLEKGSRPKKAVRRSRGVSYEVDYEQDVFGKDLG